MFNLSEMKIENFSFFSKSFEMTHILSSIIFLALQIGWK